MRQINAFLHRPRDDLVVQRDVGNQLVVGQQGFFYQGVAGGQIGFFADAFYQCVLLRLAETPQIEVAVAARANSAYQ